MARVITMPEGFRHATYGGPSCENCDHCVGAWFRSGQMACNISHDSNAHPYNDHKYAIVFSTDVCDSHKPE